MTQSSTWKYVNSFPGYYKVAIALLGDGQSVLITGGTRAPLSGAGTRDTYLYSESSAPMITPGRMVTPRFGHTATTLADGSVLIAGSEALDMTSDPYAQTSELYDATTGQFSALPNMLESRGWHTATLLPSTNEVLIVGGEDPAMVNSGVRTPKITAELYNPATRTFRRTKGNLSFGHSKHTATILPNGKVLIAGGFPHQKELEIYDPSTETFSTAGNLQIGRHNHAASPLNDGRVLIAGGYEYGGTPNQCEEVFSPTTMQITATAPIPKTAYGLSTSTLLSGKVVAVGGCANDEHFTSLTIDQSTLLFDPATMAFTPDTPCLTRIAYQCAKVLASGHVYLIGGAGISNTICAQGILYSPESVTLHIRFSGTGYGTVSCVPSGIATSQSMDVQVPVGMYEVCTAQPACPSFSVGWRKVPGTKISAARFEKVLIRKSHSFDGWGTTPPLDTQNPITIHLTQDMVLEVHFTMHTSSSSMKLPTYPKLKDLIIAPDA